MIVITTYNGEKYLKRLLNSLENINCKIPVSVINSASTEEKTIQYLQNIEKDNPFSFSVNIYHSKENIWESGAPVFALNNIEADKYFFLQDSIVIKHSLFFERLESFLKKGTVVYLISFPENFYVNREEVGFVVKNFGSYYFQKGCFGSMFFIHKSDLLTLPLEKIPKINNKFETCAMERGWSVLFYESSLKIKELEGYYDFHRLIEDDYVLFSKYFGGRE